MGGTRDRGPRVTAAAFALACSGIGDAHASPWGRAPKDELTIYRFDYYRSSGQERAFEQIVLETYLEKGLVRDYSLSVADAGLLAPSKCRGLRSSLAIHPAASLLGKNGSRSGTPPFRYSRR